MFIVQLDPKIRVWQRLNHIAVNLNDIIFCQNFSLKMKFKA